MQTVTVMVGLNDGRKFEKMRNELIGYKGAKVTIKKYIENIYIDINYNKFLILEIDNETVLIPKESISYIEVTPEK